MDQDLIKKKNDLMKSIMLNPKLSRSFKEALSAPIGSTKREQAKSVLSIMRKVGGIQDGQGGPVLGAPAAAPTNPVLSSPNYGNMLIFPAAPSFKASNVTLPGQKPAATGLNIKGAPTQNNSFSGIKPLPAAPASTFNLKLPSATTPVNSGLNQGGKTLWGNIPTAPTPQTTQAPQSNTALTPGQFGGDGQPGGATRSFIGPTQTPQSGGATRSFATSSSGSASKVSSPAPQVSEADRLRQSAQSAVNQGTGAGLFAMNEANAKFGGGLDQYMNNLDAKLKTDFNLEPLEQELSSLKSMKQNLVPTLTQYIKGKDQYLRFIDKMIDSTEGDLLKTDMGNPAVANSYNNYLQYLYTLRGRQNQRYGNFLNSAVADYEADVTETQTNYENVYKHYSDAMTRQGTLAQNEYNTLYTTMADLYTNLEQAPIKRANLEALRLQNLVNTKALLGNADDSTTNPDYWKDVKTYTEMITSKETGKEGTLDENTLTEQGLAGYYTQNMLQGGDEAAMTEAIRRALTTTLQTSSNPATISKVKKWISELSSYPDPAATIFSGSLNNSVSKTSSNLLSSYILGKIDPIKSATSSLLKSSSGFMWTGLGADKPGLQDKEGWMKKNSSLDKDFLESLYGAMSATVSAAPEYGKNPDTLINTIFSGKTNEENASNLANIIAVSS